ncbi:MAG: hypothetical protein ACXVQT_08015 [Actinomycetota bacterium]
MQRPDIARDRPQLVFRLGVTALVIHVLVPLLPFYGNGFQFFWQWVPDSVRLRFVLEYVVNGWNGAVALVFGILMIRRDRVAVAGGVFVAIAVVVAAGVIGQVIPQPSSVLHEWRADVVLGLKTIEAATLVVAASMALQRSD